MTDKQVGQIVADAAAAVHRALGPGRREMNYEVALAHELARRGLQIERQVAVPDAGTGAQEPLKADIVADGMVAVMIYSVEMVTPEHEQRLRALMRRGGYRLGYLLDFSQPSMEDGLVRIFAAW